MVLKNTYIPLKVHLLIIIQFFDTPIVWHQSYSINQNFGYNSKYIVTLIIENK